MAPVPNVVNTLGVILWNFVASFSMLYVPMCTADVADCFIVLDKFWVGHSWLSACVKAFRLKDDDNCVCGAQETVVHALVDCPR